MKRYIFIFLTCIMFSACTPTETSLAPVVATRIEVRETATAVASATPTKLPPALTSTPTPPPLVSTTSTPVPPPLVTYELPTTTANILPAPVYFKTGTTITRLERDGLTTTPLVTTTAPIDHWQFSSEKNILYYQTDSKIFRIDTLSLAAVEVVSDVMWPASVHAWLPGPLFSFSAVNDKLAYVNQENDLVITDALGQNPQILVSGESVPLSLLDETAAFPGYTQWELEQQIHSPLWSPMGEWLAFSQGGSHMIAADNRNSRLLLSIELGYEFENEGAASTYLGTVATARSWSSDGSKLLVEETYFTLDHPDYRWFIEDITAQTHIETDMVYSDSLNDLWSQEDSTKLYSWSHGDVVYSETSFILHDVENGLYRNLLVGDHAGAMVDALYETPAGEILLFAGPNASIGFTPTQYTLYRTVTDNPLAELTPLRDDIFSINPKDYLWASDGSGVIIRQQIYGEGSVEDEWGTWRWTPEDAVWLWVPIDKTQPIVSLELPTTGRLQLAWGS